MGKARIPSHKAAFWQILPLSVDMSDASTSHKGQSEENKTKEPSVSVFFDSSRAVVLLSGAL